MKSDDLLVEILTEELPPRNLLTLAKIFSEEIGSQLQKAKLKFSQLRYFATPRRLAVLVSDLEAQQPDQMVERKGPALKAAFDSEGKPTPAYIGFARSLGVPPDQLVAKDGWVTYEQHVPGKLVTDLLPNIVNQALNALPIPKRMRWGDSDIQFVRPVHSVLMLYGSEIVPAEILGCKTSNKTRGHRFHAPKEIEIKSPHEYEAALEKAFVIADYDKRKKKIEEENLKLIQKKLGDRAQYVNLVRSDLLDEVTALVEWPVPLIGTFDESFLSLPEEVLAAAMEDHQRYFPILESNNGNARFSNHFVKISNIESKNPPQEIEGDNRVVRARLADAAFFFATDKKENLQMRLERLKGIIFQAKLGTLYDKAQRLSELSAFIAKKLQANENAAKTAGLLAKSDLTTQMVNEFPELQGKMGYHYAIEMGLSTEIAEAIRDQYRPSFAGDRCAIGKIASAVAIADRLDLIVGFFGINQIPTGNKDPFGLRRAALGVIRTILENELDLDLKELVEQAKSLYQESISNPNVVAQVLDFFQERLRYYYLDKGVSADIFAAVAALNITNLKDIDARIKAVKAFKKLPEAESLSIANKRVSNILSKYTENLASQTVNPAFLQEKAEKVLNEQLNEKKIRVETLSRQRKYDEVLFQLAELRQPIDDFFDKVMVMTDEKAQRENRILLLNQLRSLFLQVADIALLQ